MPFTDPTTQLSSSDITPGTLAGSNIVVGTPGADEIDINSTPWPEILFKSSNAAITQPGQIGMTGLGANTFVVQGPATATGTPDNILFEADSNPLNQLVTLSYAGGFEIDSSSFTQRLTMNQSACSLIGSWENYGQLTVNAPIKFAPGSGSGAWQNVSYRTGWADYDTINAQRVQARRLPDGTVLLRGKLKATAGAVTGTAFDLPTDCHPFGQPQAFALGCASNVGAVLVVYPDGHVDVTQASAAPTWLSVGGAVWDTTS
jgi:hypothetical protein